MNKNHTYHRPVDILNAREGGQKQAMQHMLQVGDCPFCAENLAKYHKVPNLKEGKYWILTTNQWPYKNTKLHFLFILKQHAETLAELEAEAMTELGEMSQWLEKEYAIEGGGIIMRFGDTQFSGGTIPHLHAQMMVPDIDVPGFDDEPVRARFGRARKQKQ